MWKSLDFLRKAYPTSKVIIGSDCNSLIEMISTHYTIYPKNKNHFTTMKTRTFLQPQIGKANTEAKAVRDYIITNMKLKNERVITIDGKPVSE